MKNFLFVNILILFFIIQVKAQTFPSSKTEKETIYWFVIKPLWSTQPGQNNEYLKITKVSKNIKSGAYDDLINYAIKMLDQKKMVIGPFGSENEAKTSKKHYTWVKDFNLDTTKNNLPVQTSETYYFYLVEPKINNQQNRLTYKRMPAALAGGSIKDFKDILSDVHNNELVAIGPFKDYFFAEKSKFINRWISETYNPKNKEAKTNDTTLVTMASKWQLLKKELVKDTIKGDKKNLAYTLNINFSPGYFAINALQSIKTIIEFEDGEKQTIWAISLQGESFSDNNEEIAYDDGKVWKRKVSIPISSKKKPKNIIVKSILFNDLWMHECKDIVLKL